jgi:hypothetical protein
MQDEKKPALELEDNALADPPKALDPPALRLGERRIHRAEKKRALDPHRVEPLPDDAGLERVKVRGNVRQLRHGAKPIAAPALRGNGVPASDILFPP